MGRQADEDETWEELDESMLRELSPVLDMRRYGLFQRINRQRAAYFADVEEMRYQTSSQSGRADSRPAPGRSDGASGRAGQQGERQPSGFADLSTWCCDAFVPERSPLRKASAQLPAVEDQPTIALSGLCAPQPFYLADVPTVPMPSLLKPAFAAPALAPVPANRQPAGRPGYEEWQAMLRRFWQSLWRFCSCRLKRPPRRAHKKMSARARGRELVLERLRERSQQGALPRTPPRPPGGRRTRIEPPPIDRLFG